MNIKAKAAVVGLSVVAVAAIGLAVFLFVGRPPAVSPAAATAKTFTMHGSLRIANNFAGSIAYSKGTSCRGGGGFSDLAEGTAVQIADPQGQVVATGALGWSQSDQVTTSMPFSGGVAPIIVACEISFTVPDVPDDLSSYVLTIAHRPAHVVPSAEAHDRVQLSVG